MHNQGNGTCQLQDTQMLKLPHKNFKADVITIYLPQGSRKKIYILIKNKKTGNLN